MNAGLVEKLYGSLTGCCMLVSRSRASSSILLACFPDRRPLGSIVLPEVPMKGNSIQATSLTNRTCSLFACGENGEIVLCVCLYDVQEKRANSFASSLYSTGLPLKQVLVIASLASDELRGAPMMDLDPSDGPLLFLLSTQAARAEREDGGASSRVQIPILLSGTVVGGLPAAILSGSQARGISADLIVHVEMVPSLAPLAVRPLAASILQILSTSKWPLSIIGTLGKSAEI